MHTIVPVSQWKPRAAALGLSLNELAQAAGVSHTVLYRKLKDADEANFTRATMEAVSRVILEREAKLRDHLAAVDAGAA